MPNISPPPMPTPPKKVLTPQGLMRKKLQEESYKKGYEDAMKGWKFEKGEWWPPYVLPPSEGGPAVLGMKNDDDRPKSMFRKSSKTLTA